MIIPITSDNLCDTTYYLMIDSHPEKYVKYGNAYFNIEDWEDVHLEVPSVVNLKVIYKDNVNERILGGFPPKSYKKLIRAFKEYQEEHPDEYYDELKSKL